MSENKSERAFRAETQIETQAELQVALTPQAILKSRKKFEEYAENYSIDFIADNFKEAPGDRIVTVKAELTQSPEGLSALLNESYILNGGNLAYHLLWFVVNEKEELVNAVRHLNSKFKKGFGIYLSKAFLHEDKIDFEILSQPEVAKKSSYTKRNLNCN